MLRSPYFYSVSPLESELCRWIYSSQILWSKMPSASLFQLCTIAVLLVSSLLFGATAQGDTCLTQSQPNPIAEQYPDLPTGTLNTTLAIIPIPLKKAKSILPPQWRIIERAYRELLPDFPKDMYPVFLQAGRDLDIRVASFDYHGPDFSVGRIALPSIHNEGSKSIIRKSALAFPSLTSSVMAIHLSHGRPGR